MLAHLSRRIGERRIDLVLPWRSRSRLTGKFQWDWERAAVRAVPSPRSDCETHL